MSSPQKILHALDVIQQQTGGSFLKVEIAPDGVYSVFISAGSKSTLHAGISNNSPVLKPPKSLTPQQQATLQSRGWKGIGNRLWSRNWTDVSSHESKQEVVLEILTVLSEVLGKRGEIVLTVHVVGPNRVEINRELEAQGYNLHVAHPSNVPIISIMLFMLIFFLGILFYFLAAP